MFLVGVNSNKRATVIFNILPCKQTPQFKSSVFHLLDQVLREKWSFTLKLNYASVNFFYVISQRINMFFYLTVKKFPCYLPIMKSHRNYSPMAFDFPFILNSQLIWCNQSIYVKRSPITLISLLSRTFASQTIKSITPVIVFII